jgi:hypothetical protein
MEIWDISYPIKKSSLSLTPRLLLPIRFTIEVRKMEFRYQNKELKDNYSG